MFKIQRERTLSEKQQQNEVRPIFLSWFVRRLIWTDTYQ